MWLLSVPAVAQRKWNEESGFFEAVTAISGILQPLKGQEAKVRRTLEQELGKLKPQVSGGGKGGLRGLTCCSRVTCTCPQIRIRA